MVMPSITSTQNAIVIGSGIGGLAVAIRLQAMGFKTTVYEKRSFAGGRACLFSHDGNYLGDGPYLAPQLQALNELFKLAGKDLADYCNFVNETAVAQWVWEDGGRLEWCTELEQFEHEIAKSSRADAATFRRALGTVTLVQETMQAMHVESTKQSFWSHLKRRFYLARLGVFSPIDKIVCAKIKDKKLRQAFVASGRIFGGDPRAGLNFYGLLYGLCQQKYYFPVGGNQEIVAGLVRIFEDLGGKLQLNSEVSSIDIKERRVCGVKLVNQSFASADLIVSDANLAYTFSNLLRDTQLLQPLARQLRQQPRGSSTFTVYIRAKGYWPQLQRNNFVFSDALCLLIRNLCRQNVSGSDCLMLHAPGSVMQNPMAQEQCFYASIPVPNLATFSNDWSKIKQSLAAQIIRTLEQTILPGLSQALLDERTFTPVDLAAEINAHHGTPFQRFSFWNQFNSKRNASSNQLISGLYYVTTDPCSGIGIAGSIAAAKTTARAIFEREYATKETHRCGVSPKLCYRARDELGHPLSL